MKYYCRGTQQESICEHTNEGVKIIRNWNNCPPDAVFNFYSEDFPWVTHPLLRHFPFSGLPYKIGDRVKNVFPWEVRIVSSFSFERQSYLVVRSDAFPLMWIWRSFQWWLENPVKWQFFRQLNRLGMLDCEPGVIPGWQNIRLPKFLRLTISAVTHYPPVTGGWRRMEADGEHVTRSVGRQPPGRSGVNLGRTRSGVSHVLPSINNVVLVNRGDRINTGAIPTEQGWIQTQWIGDANCKHNAWSPYLQCAVNPAGDCENCQHFEKRL